MRSLLHLYIQACIYPFFIFERHHTQSILATGKNICSRSFVNPNFCLATAFQIYRDLSAAIAPFVTPAIAESVALGK